ncbi:unconventional myosin-XIX-like [Anneissia japonica]|uniref:unconventional myosin-XIX-like n=1 Tax=Anneissia japonica TaxID=1529436 RepID=UPI00142560F5|nr:unconventional myosin-XIX-like [Anneissia japonica]
MATVLTEKSNNIQVEIVSQTNSESTISTSKCPPQVKKKPSCRLKKGLKVWIHDKQEVWVPACVVSCMSDERIIVKKSEVEDVVIHGKPSYPVLYGSTDWINTEDLALLNPLSEPAVLNCLRERYLAGRYHTQTGSTLVAVNPFKETGLYAAYVIHQYHLNPKVQRPHVYGVAEAAFNNLSRRLGNINQSIIVSGESGAGKTWNARCLLKYLTTVAECNPGGFTPSPADCIERRILDSNPILEAFGNAGTDRNHNSSRFGKYIQLQFSRGNHVVGASIQTYLLEKTRVVYQSPGGRNFHIFYQMLFGANEREMKNWLLPNESSTNHFNYVQINHSEENIPRDKQAFAVTKQAMCNVGLNRSQQQELFKVLSGILHLGNVEFVNDEDFAGPCGVDSEKEGIEASVEAAAHLLGLDVDEFTKCLSFRQITASHKRRKSVFMKPCVVEECHTRRDCLAKLLYSRVFDWLVGFINGSTMAGNWKSFIGLLDVYGFESFTFNSLEQLCINYANEKLQQHFVENFLKAEQDDYQSEGIPWAFRDFTDNRPCLDIIEGRISIFALMFCCLNRTSDPASFNERLYDNISSTYLSRPHVSITTPAFVVHHYADKVTYQVDGLIEKNKDRIPPELVDLLKMSSKKFVQQLVAVDVSSQQSPSRLKGKQAAVTVVSKFKTSLDSLMSTLHQTTPHYIRCIKPSFKCEPNHFDNIHVINQLRACGVLETVQISSRGFPTRMLYSEFLKRYELLLQGCKEDVTGFDIRNKCAIVTDKVFGEDDKENNEKSLLFGKTKIFLREGQLDHLEVARLRAVNLSACRIQRYWRKFLATRRRQQTAASVLQAAFRGWKVREDMKRRHEAARIIQCAMVGYSIRLHQRRLEQQLNEVQLEEDVSIGSDVSFQAGVDCSSDHVSTEESCTQENNTILSAVSEDLEDMLQDPFTSVGHVLPNDEAGQVKGRDIIKEYAKTSANDQSSLLAEDQDKAIAVDQGSDITEEHGSTIANSLCNGTTDVHNSFTVKEQANTIMRKLVQAATTPAVDIAFGILLLGLLYHGPIRI